MEVSVSVPTAAPVGLWNLTVESWYGDRRAERRIFKATEPIYVLFNPYHQGKLYNRMLGLINLMYLRIALTDDPVHLPHPAGREEYVLNEVGKIYGGSHNSVQGRPWIFGQLRDSVLPAACHLLDEVSSVRDSERGDPVRVARAVSAIVNSVDDDGVVMGKWDGAYSDGTKPFEWTGSVPILEERMRTGKPVRYGQCWVFAGVVATSKSIAIFYLAKFLDNESIV